MRILVINNSSLLIIQRYQSDCPFIEYSGEGSETFKAIMSWCDISKLEKTEYESTLTTHNGILYSVEKKAFFMFDWDAAPYIGNVEKALIKKLQELPYFQSVESFVSLHLRKDCQVVGDSLFNEKVIEELEKRHLISRSFKN